VSSCGGFGLLECVRFEINSAKSRLAGPVFIDVHIQWIGLEKDGCAVTMCLGHFSLFFFFFVDQLPSPFSDPDLTAEPTPYFI